MSGEMVTFQSNGGTANGYLSVPASGKGPGVIVIQEWWGLVPHIKDVCDRFAAEGYVALAPDIYHGESTKSPDEAGKLMMALRIDEAEKDLRGAIGYLLNHEATTGDEVGTVGFCMGGALSLYAASKNPQVGACVVFYGIHPNVKPDLAELAGSGAWDLRRTRCVRSAGNGSRTGSEIEGAREVGRDAHLSRCGSRIL